MNTPTPKQLEAHHQAMRSLAAKKAAKTRHRRYNTTYEWESPLCPAEEEIPVGKGVYCGRCGERVPLPHYHPED